MRPGPKRIVNGKHLSPQRTAQILAGLCAGHSINQVAKATGANWFTVRSVQFNHSKTVEDKKRLLADRSENAAADALDILHHKLLRDGHSLRTAELVPVYGVLIDKAALLRQDPTSPIQVQHQHIHAHIREHLPLNEILARLPKSRNEQNPHALE